MVSAESHTVAGLGTKIGIGHIAVDGDAIGILLESLPVRPRCYEESGSYEFLGHSLIQR